MVLASCGLSLIQMPLGALSSAQTFAMTAAGALALSMPMGKLLKVLVPPTLGVIVTFRVWLTKTAPIPPRIGSAASKLPVMNH